METLPYLLLKIKKGKYGFFVGVRRGRKNGAVIVFRDRALRGDFF